MVRDNALLLSVAAQFNESVSVEIMGWLANTTIVLGSSDERIWEMAIAQIDDPSMKRRIVEFARFADFGIDDIRKVDNTVISSHQQYDEEGNATKTVTFPFRVNESEGTIKYFSLAYPIIDALDHGKRLVVDEFDSKMHPLLTSRIIGLFNSRVTNPRNAQLISRHMTPTCLMQACSAGIRSGLHRKIRLEPRNSIRWRNTRFATVHLSKGVPDGEIWRYPCHRPV